MGRPAAQALTTRKETRGLKVWSQAHGGFYGGCEAVRMCQGLAEGAFMGRAGQDRALA